MSVPLTFFERVVARRKVLYAVAIGVALAFGLLLLTVVFTYEINARASFRAVMVGASIFCVVSLGTACLVELSRAVTEPLPEKWFFNRLALPRYIARFGRGWKLFGAAVGLFGTAVFAPYICLSNVMATF